MSTQFTSPVGRLVQGGFKLQPKKDIKGNLVKDSEGKQVEECFIALAIPKKLPNGTDNPEVGPFYALFDAQARASFPHLFPNGGACTHPRFAFKWQDGDGVDNNGQSVAGKPGFAGHWIIKMATRYAPRVYARDGHGNLVQLEDPEKIIKTGYRISVGGTIDGNGVEAGNSQAVPGLFVSPNLVLFVAPDEEIVSGPDPNAVFANVQSQAGVAAGAAAAGLARPPQPGAPAGAPPMPGAAPAPAGAPPMPGGAPTPQGNAPMPGGAAMPSPAAASPASGSPPMPGGAAPMPPAAPAQPQYATTASAQGATLEQLLALNWTIDGLLAAGHIVRTA